MMNFVSILFRNNQIRLINNSMNIFNQIVSRNLYSAAALGVDNYIKTRERIKNQFINIEEKFKNKLVDITSNDSNSMVFTEDLKHMIHLAESNGDDLQLVERMMLKFSKQNKGLRFGSYIFGPVVMRMYYYLDKPIEAYNIFRNPDMDGFFDQLMSFQILMDLLLIHKKFNEVLEVFNVIKKKQMQDSKYPKNAVVLVLAACYKLNTPESFSYAKNLWSDLIKVGHYPMRRGGTFAAALALNQNSPDIALEILGSLKQQTYVTIRNLKIAVLADLNRPDDALPILRLALQTDSSTDRKHTYADEVINRLKNSIEKLDKPEIKEEFEKLEKHLRSLNYITYEPLDEHLCSEIALNPRYGHENKDPGIKDFRRTRYNQRSGLQDMF